MRRSHDVTIRRQSTSLCRALLTLREWTCSNPRTGEK